MAAGGGRMRVSGLDRHPGGSGWGKADQEGTRYNQLSLPPEVLAPTQRGRRTYAHASKPLSTFSPVLAQ